MLGFGIGEIILIVIVAIIVLGPDKLPNALVEMAKILRVLKKTLNDAKETLDKEVNLAELKREAEAYKEKLEQSVDISKEIKDANLVEDIKKDMNDIEHLFKDYQPKTIQLDSEKENTAEEITRNQSPLEKQLNNEYSILTQESSLQSDNAQDNMQDNTQNNMQNNMTTKKQTSQDSHTMRFENEENKSKDSSQSHSDVRDTNPSHVQK